MTSPSSRRLLVLLFTTVLAGCELTDPEAPEANDAAFTESEHDTIENEAAIQLSDDSETAYATPTDPHPESVGDTDERYEIEQILEAGATLLDQERYDESILKLEEGHRRLTALDPESEYLIHIRAQIDGVRYMRAKANDQSPQ